MDRLTLRNRRWKTVFLLVIMIFSGSFALLGAGPSDLPDSDTMVVCISSKVLSLDPTNYRDRDTQMVLKNMFDSLTTRDKHLQVVPQLAESWQAVDQTTWEFKLRKGVTFHNGDEFTASDVKFTLDRVTKEGGLHGGTSPRKTLLDRISGVNVLDSHTVRIMTDKPWPILPLMLTLQEMVPQNYLQKVGSENFEKKPVGCGPFKFVREKNNNTLVLERFEEYYGGSLENSPVQKAPVKYLIFKTIPDQARRTALLKKGEADIISDVPLEAIPLLEMLPGISVASQTATRSYFADLNCKKPPFDNPNARRAINYAMDMKMVVNAIFQGKAMILPTILLHQAFAFNGRLIPYPYDPEQAKLLFRQAKFPDGYVVKIVCIEKYGKFANIISLFLSKVGIKAKVIIEENHIAQAAMKNLEADILVTSWGNTTLDPVGILLPKLKTRGRGNFSNYSNNKVDQLLYSAENTLSVKDRDAYYKEIQKIIYKDAPMVFGYASEEFYGVSQRVKGFYPASTGMLNLHDVSLE